MPAKSGEVFTSLTTFALFSHRFSLSTEIFDLQSSLLHLYAAVFAALDPSQGVNAGQVQCKLVPLIPAIQDSATLYDVIFKLMKALHACT